MTQYFVSFTAGAPSRQASALGAAGLALPKGPALQLAETWQAEVVGSTIVRAGIQGAVKWTSADTKTLAASTPFRIEVGVPLNNAPVCIHKGFAFVVFIRFVLIGTEWAVPSMCMILQPSVSCFVL